MNATSNHTEDRVRNALRHLADETPQRPDLADLHHRARNDGSEHVEVDDQRPRRARLVAALAAALVVATGAMAIASGGYTGEDSPDAVYRPMSDLADVVETGAADLPFAPHRSIDNAIAAWTETFDPDETMATDTMINMAADAAVCSWMDQWRIATLAGDEPSAAQALSIIQEARVWPWWSLVNERSAYDRLGSHVKAMQANDLDYVTYTLGLNCLPAMTDVPSISPTGQGPLPDGVVVLTSSSPANAAAAEGNARPTTSPPPPAGPDASPPPPQSRRPPPRDIVVGTEVENSHRSTGPTRGRRAGQRCGPHDCGRPDRHDPTGRR